MATEIDELIVQISADTRGLKTELGRVKEQLNKAFPEGSGSPVNKFGAALRGLAGPLAAVAGGLGAIGAVKGISSVADEFEALNITLGRIYGGQQAGQQAFDDIKVFAETTPFQLEDVTKAFIALKSNGIEPNTEMLTIFGDAASAAMNPLEAFNSLIRITQRAAGGGLGLEELEQLVNQGIPVYTILQEELGKSRTELSELGKTAEGASTIMTALQKGLKEEFGGIMAERMELLSTKTSNLVIAFKQLAATIAESGLQQFLKNVADDMTVLVNRIRLVFLASRMGVSQELAGAATGGGNFFETARKEQARLMQILEGQQRDLAERQTSLGKSLAEMGGEGVLQILRSTERDLDAVIDVAINKADEVGEGYGNVINQVITPQITAMTLKVRELNNEFAQIEAPEDSPQFTLIKNQIAILNARMNALKELRTQLNNLDQTAPMAGLLIGGGTAGGDAPATMTTGQIEALAAMRKALEDTVTAAEELQILKDQFEEAKKTGKLTSDEIKRLGALFTKMGDEITLDGLEEQFGDLQSVISKTIDPADQLKDSIDAIQAIIDKGDAGVLKFLFGDRSPEEIKAVMATLRDDLKDLKTDTTETAETFKETLAPAIQQISLAFTNEFVNALLTGQNALDSFKSFARNIVSQIISIFLQLAVVNRILNAIFGAGTFSTLDLSGGTGLGGMKVNPGTGLATGGSMMRGKPYLVGERGPELFVPSVAGTLKSGNDTRGMMGGGPPIVVNQSLNFSTGVVPTVRAEVQRMLPQISETTKASVLEATRRGGSYRRGLLGA